MPTSKDFRGSGSHRQLFRPYWGPPAWHSRWVNERGKPTSQQPLTVEVSAKQFIKRQLHTTHLGAVGWEQHSSSTMTCAGKVDHELPVNQSKEHTHTNPRPSHYLTHAHSHITRAVAAMDSGFAHTRANQHGIAVGQWPGKNRVQRPFPAEASPLSASSTQHLWELLTGNRTATLSRHARGRRIMGLVQVCPLL